MNKLGLLSPAALLNLAKPNYLYGRWRKPKISARIWADMRKLALARQIPFEDLPKKEPAPRHPKARIGPKGKRRHFAVKKREEMIKKAMERMPKLEAEYREGLRQQKKEFPSGIKILFKGKVINEKKKSGKK